MENMIDEVMYERCMNCHCELPSHDAGGAPWLMSVCPKCVEPVRMEFAKADIEIRHQLWQQYVALVCDWFTDAENQPIDKEHLREQAEKRETTQEFFAKKLHNDDQHTAKEFNLAMTVRDFAKCKRLWGPVCEQIAANHKMIASGIKPSTGPPADPEPDLTKPDAPSSLRKLQDLTPPLDIESADWIPASAKNKKKLGLAPETLSKYRSPKHGGHVLNEYFGRDKQGRRWRRAETASPKSTIYYYRKDLEKYYPNRGYNRG